MSKLLEKIDKLAEEFDPPLGLFTATEQGQLIRALRTTVEALEKLKTLDITDGCEECSSVWQRRYELKAPVEALAAAEKEICGEEK